LLPTELEGFGFDQPVVHSVETSLDVDEAPEG
jgi:hypothetical protein